MLIRSHKTTLLQIFCKHSLNSQVIFKSIKVAEDTLYRNSEYEWVKLLLFVRPGVCSGHEWVKFLRYLDDDDVRRDVDSDDANDDDHKYHRGLTLT